MAIGSGTAHQAIKILNDRHEFYKSWMLVSDELGGYNKGVLCAVANGSRKPSKKLISLMNELIPGCEISKRTPRRCYDLSDKEARRIAVDILSILHS